MKLRIPFTAAEMPRWIGEYTRPELDIAPIDAGLAARERGWMTKDEFACIARWKLSMHWRFAAKHIEANEPQQVRECSRRAFLADDPLRCVVLLSDLSGVKCAAASALLHLFHRSPFPIADRHALHAVGVPPKVVDKGDEGYLSVWQDYVGLCREYASANAIDMRSLDRALWGFGATAARS